MHKAVEHMRRVAQSDPVLTVAVCAGCGRWYQVAEGAVLPLCRHGDEAEPGPMHVEHHVQSCFDHLGDGCICPWQLEEQA